MFLRLMALCSTLLLGANVYASGSMKIRMVTTNAVTELENDGEAYVTSSVKGKVKVTMSGTGEFAGLKQTQEANIEDQDTQNAETRMVLLPGEGKAGIIRQTTINLTEEGPVEGEVDLEIVLVEGTWDDFTSGKNVKAKLTKEGEKKHRSEQARLGKVMSDMIAAGLRDQGAQLKGVKVAVKASTGDTMTLSQSKIISPAALIDLTVTISL